MDPVGSEVGAGVRCAATVARRTRAGSRAVTAAARPSQTGEREGALRTAGVNAGVTGTFTFTEGTFEPGETGGVDAKPGVTGRIAKSAALSLLSRPFGNRDSANQKGVRGRWPAAPSEPPRSVAPGCADRHTR